MSDVCFCHYSFYFSCAPEIAAVCTILNVCSYYSVLGRNSNPRSYHKYRQSSRMDAFFLLAHGMLHWHIDKKRIKLSDICKYPATSGNEQKHIDMCKEQNPHPDNTIPIGFHGAGVPHQKKIQWNVSI